jgi:hypothetical protein
MRISVRHRGKSKILTLDEMRICSVMPDGRLRRFMSVLKVIDPAPFLAIASSESDEVELDTRLFTGVMDNRLGYLAVAIIALFNLVPVFVLAKQDEQWYIGFQCPGRIHWIRLLARESAVAQSAADELLAQTEAQSPPSD